VRLLENTTKRYRSQFKIIRLLISSRILALVLTTFLSIGPSLSMLYIFYMKVCTECDTSVWRSQSTSVYFKWCKGCKRFHNILMFREKLQLLRESGKKQLTKLPSKCDPCRQRGRLGYRSKKVLGFVFNSFFFLQTHR